MLTRLSVKSKVVLMLVAISLISALVIGGLGWRSSRRALSETIFANMTALRRSKAAQVEAYFRNMRYSVEILSENDMVVEAMVRFNRGFRQLENSTIPPAWDTALEAYYTSQFFPKLFANLPGQADYNLYRPQNQAGLYLQYQYIVANRFEDGQKFLLDSAEDGSDYSKAHAYYHPRLRTVIQKFGFDDLILVNFETGDVVYTVSKQTEFASNLDQGPYRRSNEATAVELVRNNTERGRAQLVDFELYRPGYGIPSAFWTAPIYNGSHLVGVLLVQISMAAINQIMSENQQWLQLGLGTTGETYLVGADGLMRSDARQRIEDPVAYQTTLTELGISPPTRTLIDKLSTTILLQEAKSPGVTAALQNQEGTLFSTNYLGTSVLTSYQPLILDGLPWAILTEMEAGEVFAPVYAFQRQLLISMVLMIVTLTFVAVGIAYVFVRPLNLLIEGARTIGDGTGNRRPEHAELAYDASSSDKRAAPEIKIYSHDEWGELATSFTEMAQGVRRQAALLLEKDQEIGQLLHNLLPMSAVQRVQQGKTDFIDQVAQVTIYVARIEGVAAFAQKKGGQEVTTLLQELMNDLNEAAGRYDVERLPASGQRIMAVCGLSTPYLDHSRRMADFALALGAILHRLNTRHSAQLTLHGGVHSGAVSGSVIRTQQMNYELWGESVTVAQQLATEADPDLLLTSQTIYDRLHDLYHFQRPRAEQRPEQRTGQRGTGQATSWVLVGAKNEGSA